MKAEAGPLAQCLANADHRISWCDDAFLELLARDRNEVIGRHPLEFTYGEDQKLNAGLLNKLATHGTAFTITKRYKRGDHALQWVTNNISHVSDGLGPRRVMATSTPIMRPITTETLMRNFTVVRRLCAGLVTGRQLFGADLISIPAAEVILLLYKAEIEGQSFDGEELARWLKLSTTATLRWLQILVNRGLIATEGGEPATSRTPVRITRQCELLLDQMLSPRTS